MNIRRDNLRSIRVLSSIDNNELSVGHGKNKNYFKFN